MRVIIDTDPGVDDALALLLALRSPELEVKAITTVNGNVALEQATKNAALVLDLLGPEPRPILARGAARTLGQGFVRARSVHGSDGLGELNRFKNPDGTPRYRFPQLPQDIPDATEVLLGLLGQYPEELTLITLGPLTNLAEALQADKRRVMGLREVVIMGGAIRIPGNIAPGVEFNISVDPYAAQRVFQSGLPIKLIPLDVTERVCLDSTEVKDLAQAMPEPLGMFLSDVTEKAMEYMREVRGKAAILLHDPLAVGVAVDPTIVTTTSLYVDVETHDGITRGMTIADLRPIRDDLKQSSNLRVALEVASERFLSFFKERLCQGSS
jgi:purine nucleosidase/pyrimidine-specific ribonucleoside hydrolase